jgi:peptidoglycan/xylan/chitin deacetylase (PgdA/CDA1 family)
VCLTFDDGPHPVYTPRVLDALKAAVVPATFFVVGERAERHPDLIRRIVAEGHALGHHSFTHSAPPLTSAGQLLNELYRTQTVLTAAVAQRPKLFRPPHGKLTARKALGLWRQGQTVVLWNVDPKDFARGSADELRAWFRDHPLDGGDIVLLHDNQPHAAGALVELVTATRARGLTFTTPLSWLPASRAGTR